MTKKKQVSSFEQNLKRLEEISEKLESEEIGLDDAIELFEKGVKLSKSCLATLKNAELKITELKKDLSDFSDDEDDELDE
ncbi:exodeoxyribonuclease 7 small subunit [bacterium BMS3Abin03]|nr:exodeoxyribonuclease 7 small subunit [bacterium BMS3Abin03]HDZ58705.1 exodeoxyribonuclease VII small subunit [Ignavibacteriales bacterium]